MPPRSATCSTIRPISDAQPSGEHASYRPVRRSKSTTAVSRSYSGSHHQIHRDQHHRPKRSAPGNISQALVERTFSWFGRNRRLTKDYENLVESLAAFVALASIQIAVRQTRALVHFSVGSEPGACEWGILPPYAAAVEAAAVRNKCGETSTPRVSKVIKARYPGSLRSFQFRSRRRSRARLTTSTEAGRGANSLR